VTLGLPGALRAEIFACGYFPQFVADAMELALGGEEVRGYLVHHEATISREEIGRHLSVLVLTPTRLVVGHTDDSTGTGEGPRAITTTESVPLRKVTSVSLSQVVANPGSYGAADAAVVEAWLQVGWGTMRNLDVEPAGCGDPDCEADHGYTGVTSDDDLNVRMSTAADGAAKVDQLMRFATTMQLACA